MTSRPLLVTSGCKPRGSPQCPALLGVTLIISRAAPHGKSSVVGQESLEVVVVGWGLLDYWLPNTYTGDTFFHSAPKATVTKHNIRKKISATLCKFKILNVYKIFAIKIQNVYKKLIEKKIWFTNGQGNWIHNFLRTFSWVNGYMKKYLTLPVIQEVLMKITTRVYVIYLRMGTIKTARENSGGVVRRRESSLLVRM